MKMLNKLKAVFAWRDVRDTGVWRYQENSVTGERRAVPGAAKGWRPVDRVWLAGGEWS